MNSYAYLCIVDRAGPNAGNESTEHTVVGFVAWLDFESRPGVPRSGYSMDCQTECVAKNGDA